MNNIIKYVNTDDYLEDVCTIIDSSQSYAYKSVNAILVIRNWYIGKRIAEEELKGSSRAEYGTELVDSLAKILTEKYGKGFTRRAIYQYISFYRKFPQIVYSQGTQFGADENVYLLSTQTELLSWTHYRTLLQVEDDEARLWYEKEAYNQVWSVKTLQRNIYSQYYYRILKTQDKIGVENEMKELTSKYQKKLEFIKNPVIAEFLGMQENTSYYESDLEQCIIDNLQKFLMELGRGYAFVARQQHIHTEKEDYYIDLVFYNYILKCFVLID